MYDTLLVGTDESSNANRAVVHAIEEQGLTDLDDIRNRAEDRGVEFVGRC